MTKVTSSISIEKSSEEKNGKWLLRDTDSGQVREVRTTKRSREIIKQSASANKPLLDRLAKR